MRTINYYTWEHSLGFVFFLKFSFSASVLIGITYLDHAAATLYPESLLRNYCQDISRNVYGERAWFNEFIHF